MPRNICFDVDESWPKARQDATIALGLGEGALSSIAHIAQADPVDGNMDRFASRFDATLAAALSSAAVPEHLGEAMRAAALGGGKRFRPYLVAVTHSVLGLSEVSTLRVAAAVELLHAASLVLDDLPCMDDAAERRGAPALHRRFGEASAVLAATALIARAFGLLSEPAVSPDPARRCELVNACAVAIGAGGIAGGQALELAGAAGKPHKTADLIAFCCESGAILAGSNPSARRQLRDFGFALGLVFQNRDDALDEAAAPNDKAAIEARRLAIRLQAELGDAAAERLAAMVDWAQARTS